MNTDIDKLEPAFDFLGDRSSVLLHKNKAEICIEGNRYSGDAEVRLDLLPQAKIYIYGSFSGVPSNNELETRMDQKKISSFLINDHRVEGFRISSGNDKIAQHYDIKWCPNLEPITGVGNATTQMTRIVFHLFNFVDLVGTRRSMEQNGTLAQAIEHVKLDCDNWKIELRSVFSTRKDIEKLKQEGGYRLTHIGDIKKPDQTSFTGGDADECLDALRFFLSFAKGGWCEPICAVGFDASGKRVWESWSSPKDPWQYLQSWFDPHNSSQISLLFPGFMKRWEDKEWRKALREVIYWYLNANFSSRGIDAGIILTQAAIERLSYEYSVKERKLLIPKGFKDLWASDKFRLLFSSLGIPLDIPTTTPNLHSALGQKNWLDAPHLLTEIRNFLVHPEHNSCGLFGDAYYEAWNLGLWYLEMGILAICGYSGTYGNRLNKERWVGQTENVPWN